MTETLFERYKEALRAGHVAALRGRLEEAASAYREAMAIAGDRAVPHSALGGVLLRMGDPEAALAAYDTAIWLAPGDDAAILGRAQALVVMRRTDEAAATYDRLANVRDAGGRLREAVEAARRALAIEPTNRRRARHAALTEALRAREGAGHDAEAPAAGAGDVPAVEPGPPGPGPGAVADGGTPPPADAGGAEEVEGAAPTATGPLPDPEPYIAAMEGATARRDASAAAAAALAAARAYRARGHVVAATDACLQGIGAAPGDVELHLLLADLATERGWSGQAGDTYRHLLRLVELGDDPALVATVRAAAEGHLPDDPRFARS